MVMQKTLVVLFAFCKEGKKLKMSCIFEIAIEDVLHFEIAIEVVLHFEIAIEDVLQARQSEWREAEEKRIASIPVIVINATLVIIIVIITVVVIIVIIAIVINIILTSMMNTIYCKLEQSTPICSTPSVPRGTCPLSLSLSPSPLSSI